MKNLTKKERFDKVLAELKAIEGLDIIASYYYDHKELYTASGKESMYGKADFLDLSIVLVNPIAISGTDKEEIINDYDTLVDASLYAALCGEIGYYFDNPVIIAFTNEYTDEKTVHEVKAIYKTYFNKKGDIADGYMEVCNIFSLNMLGDSCDNSVLFEDEFKITSDTDFLNYRATHNCGEGYMIRKLIRDVTRQVWNYMKGPEVSADNFIEILADDGINNLAATIASKVHKEMGSNILNDKIFTEFIINEDYIPEDPVIAEAKKA